MNKLLLITISSIVVGIIFIVIGVIILIHHKSSSPSSHSSPSQGGAPTTSPSSKNEKTREERDKEKVEKAAKECNKRRIAAKKSDVVVDKDNIFYNDDNYDSSFRTFSGPNFSGEIVFKKDDWYSYESSKDALAACNEKGFDRLCNLNEVPPKCNYGFVNGKENPMYWMRKGSPGCGGYCYDYAWNSRAKEYGGNAYCCKNQKNDDPCLIPKYKKFEKSLVPMDYEIEGLDFDTLARCKRHCNKHENCHGFNYDPSTERCNLTSKTLKEANFTPGGFPNDSVFYEKEEC